jgi:hypothetical protein
MIRSFGIPCIASHNPRGARRNCGKRFRLDNKEYCLVGGSPLRQIKNCPRAPAKFRALGQEAVLEDVCVRRSLGAKVSAGCARYPEHDKSRLGFC